jgi:hypothetical protein
MMMDAYSPFHWLAGLIGFLIFVIPAVKILQKAGFSGWWVIASFIPLVNVIMFWVFAFARWPIEERATSR